MFEKKRMLDEIERQSVEIYKLKEENATLRTELVKEKIETNRLKEERDTRKTKYVETLFEDLKRFIKNETDRSVFLIRKYLDDSKPHVTRFKHIGRKRSSMKELNYMMWYPDVRKENIMAAVLKLKEKLPVLTDDDIILRENKHHNVSIMYKLSFGQKQKGIAPSRAR
jgi:hypothetical protein